MGRLILRHWRAFWQSVPARIYGTHVGGERSDGITRLRATTPTVTPAEVEHLYGPRRKPVDFEQLPC